MVEGYVYFLHAPSVGLVKIGRSIDVERRLSEVRLISPVPLQLLWYTNGGAAAEARYHQRWAHLREHGEWFRCEHELMVEIEANAIVAAWNRARQAARELALSQIDAPLMDQRYG